jgi:hypothetical protein
MKTQYDNKLLETVSNTFIFFFLWSHRIFQKTFENKLKFGENYPKKQKMCDGSCLKMISKIICMKLMKITI